MARYYFDAICILVITAIMIKATSCHPPCRKLTGFTCEPINSKPVRSDRCTSGEYFNCVNQSEVLICCKCNKYNQFSCHIAGTDVKRDCEFVMFQDVNKNDHSSRKHSEEDNEKNSNLPENDNKNDDTENDTDNIKVPTGSVWKEKCKYRTEEGESTSSTSPSSSSRPVASCLMSCLLWTVLVVMKALIS